MAKAGHERQRHFSVTLLGKRKQSAERTALKELIFIRNSKWNEL